MSKPIRTPVIWFGCKRRQAPYIWQLLGKVDGYVEPFAGSCAVMLANTNIPRKEVINDIDAFVTNFWRSVQHDHEMVLRSASKISNDLDNVAKKKYLVERYADLKEKCSEDFAYFDAQLAGFWLFCNANSLNPSIAKDNVNTRLFISPSGSGRGFQMTRTSLDPYESFEEWMHVLCVRFQRVAVLCRDWRDVKGSDYITYFNYGAGKAITGIYLDPPYTKESRVGAVYAQEDFDVAADCREWAYDRGDDPALRIVLSGYQTEFDSLPAGWRMYDVPRKAGHENFGKTKDKDRARPVEVLVASPHCHAGGSQMGLFTDREKLG